MLTRVLDTNVLLDRPFSEIIDSFEPCTIVLPLAVIRELDKFKTDANDVLRYNSRVASNFLDKMRAHGRLDKGVELVSGHIIRVDLDEHIVELPPEINTDHVDYRILKVALALQTQGENVILVTQDTNERILADVLGLRAENYGTTAVSGDKYQGWRVLTVTNDDINSLCATGKYYPPAPVLADVYQNEYFILANEINPKQTLLGKFTGEYISLFRPSTIPVYGITPVNVEQKFYLDLLMDSSISCVTAIGPAGTGKTLLALAAAMEQTKRIGDIDLYNRVIVSRSPIPFGKDIGFLPGNELEKMSPWLTSVYDSLEFLFSKSNNSQKTIDMLVDDRLIDLKALTYMRGRSIPNQFIIIDEAQNLSKDEIKTIVSRAAKNTKIVLLGDVEQIDNTRLTATNNGLVHIVEAFKGLPFYGHITLTKTERSELAEAAVKLL